MAQPRRIPRPEPGQRELHVGLYPMLSGDTTRLLVCDLDDEDWRGDARFGLIALPLNGACRTMMRIPAVWQSATACITSRRGTAPVGDSWCAGHVVDR